MVFFFGAPPTFADIFERNFPPPRKNENVQARVDWRTNETRARGSLGGGAPLGYGERRIQLRVTTTSWACVSLSRPQRRDNLFEKGSRKC